MHTEISRYHATASKDVLARLALQRASIMHLVDLKRGVTPRVAQNCGSAVSPIGRSPADANHLLKELPTPYQPVHEPAPDALAADRALGSILCESSPHR